MASINTLLGAGTFWAAGTGFLAFGPAGIGLASAMMGMAALTVMGVALLEIIDEQNKYPIIPNQFYWHRPTTWLYYDFGPSYAYMPRPAPFMPPPITVVHSGATTTTLPAGATVHRVRQEPVAPPPVRVSPTVLPAGATVQSARSVPVAPPRSATSGILPAFTAATTKPATTTTGIPASATIREVRSVPVAPQPVRTGLPASATVTNVRHQAVPTPPPVIHGFNNVAAAHTSHTAAPSSAASLGLPAGATVTNVRHVPL